MVALSVSISAITSPALTLSPSFLSQRASVPSVMVGESAGIRMFVAIGASPLRAAIHAPRPSALRDRSPLPYL